ncbi:hypothetical protein TNCV_556261 [Trichonephila clavipes]|uniref:Uncharacterized protein n=1 Tax=Trichonephila clavipes TaxID=2585209 RepID=A0A8X6RKP3_TRICX|nr:hypothetical protein TNCV_556261 [Trichonephila clavipes]
MATGSYLTPIYSRSQSEVQEDHHKMTDKEALQILAQIGLMSLKQILSCPAIQARLFKISPEYFIFSDKTVDKLPKLRSDLKLLLFLLIYTSWTRQQQQQME